MRLDFPEVIDSTMRAAFVACPRRFFWQYIREQAPEGQNVHLHAGICFARGLEISRRAFYGEGKPAEEAILDGAEALLRAWGSFDPGDHAKTVDRVLGAYEVYHATWPFGQDALVPLMTARGPAVEFNFVLPLPNVRHPSTGNPILYAGRFDMLAGFADQEGLFVVDEKTATQLGTSWSAQWTLRAQFTGYVWGAQQFGHHVSGAIVRGVSILKEKYGTAEAIVHRQPWQIEQWLHQLERDIERMIACWRAGGALAMAEWDQSLDQACAAYGGCSYLRLCDSLDPEPFIPVYYREHRWNPTERHFD